MKIVAMCRLLFWNAGFSKPLVVMLTLRQIHAVVGDRIGLKALDRSVRIGLDKFPFPVRRLVKVAYVCGCGRGVPIVNPAPGRGRRSFTRSYCISITPQSHVDPALVAQSCSFLCGAKADHTGDDLKRFVAATREREKACTLRQAVGSEWVEPEGLIACGECSMRISLPHQCSATLNPRTGIVRRHSNCAR